MLSEKEIWRPHWLIVKRCISGMDVLTVDLCGSAEALAVFRFEEETQMFLDFRLGPSGEGWRARQTSPGELASVLYGPCSGVKKVTIDPLPEAIDRDKSISLFVMDRDDFLNVLLGEGPSSLHVISSRNLGSYKGLRHSRVA
jgi:hypothetical protein